MLYALAHILRDKLSWLWLLIEKLNSCLFYIRYGKKLKNFSFKEKPNGYEIIPMREVPTEEIVNFFCHQPEEAFKFFHPHGFDAAFGCPRTGTFNVYVYAMNNVGEGSQQLIGQRQVTVAGNSQSTEIYGNFENAVVNGAQITVVGWAFDKADTSLVKNCTVYFCLKYK